MAKPETAKTPAARAVKQEIEARPIRHWRAHLFQGYVITAVIAFAVLVVAASQFDYFPIDLRITLAVQQLHARWFAIIMEAVSSIGYSPQAWIRTAVIAVLLFVFGLQWEGVMSAVAATGAAGLATLVKLMVHRPRPGADLVAVAIQLDSFSFPSGHVVFYTAFFGFLLFLAFTLFKPSARRAVVLITTTVLIALVGVSRIYLGNHWASDVTGAYLLGSLWLAASVSIYRWGKPRFFVQQPLAPAETKPGDGK